MYDVFLLHHPDDASLADEVAVELVEWGLTVGTPGRATLVIWTLAAARDTAFIGQAEAASAKSVSARFGPSRLPVAFSGDNVITVIGWHKNQDHPGWTTIVQQLAAKAHAPNAPTSDATTEAKATQIDDAEASHSSSLTVNTPQGNLAPQPNPIVIELNELPLRPMRADRLWRALPLMLSALTILGFVGFVGFALLGDV